MSDAAYHPLRCLNAIISSRCRVKPIDRLIAIALVKYANNEGECFPSFETIASETGVPRRSVAASIARLLTAGAECPVEITRVRRARKEGGRGRESNLYQLRLRTEPLAAVRSILSAPVAPKSDELSARDGRPECKGAPDLSAPVALDPPSDPPSDPPTLLPAFAGAAKKRRRAETTIPTDFVAGPEIETWAATILGFDAGRVRAEVERFRDHALANDRRVRNWPPTFRNWLRKASEIDKRDAARGPRAGATVQRGAPAGLLDELRRESDARAAIGGA